MNQTTVAPIEQIARDAELLPCPGCKKTLFLSYHEDDECNSGMFSIICDASGRSDRERGCGLETGYFDTKAQAAKWWNDLPRQACGQQPAMPEPGLIQDVYIFVEAAAFTTTTMIDSLMSVNGSRRMASFLKQDAQIMTKTTNMQTASAPPSNAESLSGENPQSAPFSQTTDPFDQIREALSLHYDYPADSIDPNRICPVTDAAFRALDAIYIDLKFTKEAVEDLKVADKTI